MVLGSALAVIVDQSVVWHISESSVINVRTDREAETQGAERQRERQRESTIRFGCNTT
jgi:hypothetical protein